MDPALLQAQKLRLEAERDELLEKERGVSKPSKPQTVLSTGWWKRSLRMRTATTKGNHSGAFRRMDERIAQEEDEARGRQLSGF